MKKFILFTLFYILLFTSCMQVQNTFGTKEIGQRNFYAIQYISNKAYIVGLSANLVKTSDHLELYLKAGQFMSASDLDYLANNFDKYYSSIIDTYGTHTDVDRNGKIIILLYDINEDIEASGGYIAGLFYPNDLLLHNPSQNIYSNEAEILYVESQASSDIENIFATVIHEFQHLINMNMNYIEKNTESHIWLNEALSESTEIFMLEAMPSHRLDIYNYYLNESIRRGNYFYTWNSDDYVLADYATASLFMYWLYQNNAGSAIFKNIAQGSLENRGTYKAVLEALRKNPQSSTDWQETLSSWLQANENAAEGYKQGKTRSMRHTYGYNFSLTSKIYSGDETTVDLYPGDAILTTKKSSPKDSNIVQTQFTKDLSSVYIALNKDTTVGSYNTRVDSIPFTIPESLQMLQRSMQKNAGNNPLDEDYRIISISQKPLDFNNIKEIKK